MAGKTEAKKINPKLRKVEALASELLKNLGIEAKLVIEKKEEGICLNLISENPSLLIGYHGKTLDAIQLILSLMVYRQQGEWVRILVDTEGYRQRRTEALERMAFSLAQKVRFSGKEQSLPPMNASERRIIHLALANDEQVTSESQGEGRERRVVIKLR